MYRRLSIITLSVVVWIIRRLILSVNPLAVDRFKNVCPDVYKDVFINPMEKRKKHYGFWSGFV